MININYKNYFKRLFLLKKVFFYNHKQRPFWLKNKYFKHVANPMQIGTNEREKKNG